MTNFGKKRNTNGFDKNPKNINRKGAPKKGISLVNEQLAEEGYGPATKQDIEVNYMSLMNLDEKKLVELGKNKKQPMLIRILAKNMMSGKGFDVIEKMLDRGIGKPTQVTEEKGELKTNITIKLPE